MSILSAHRAQHVSETVAEGGIPLTTLDYQEFLRQLKQSRQDGEWHVEPMGPLAPRTFLIIDVDKDFSAPFFLALHAAVTFSLSITEEQPQTPMRLATMSSDPIDFLYSRLVHQNDLEITSFILPITVETWHLIPVGSGEEEPFKTIPSIQDELDPDSLHTAVYFQDKFVLPPRWEEDEWEAWGWTNELFHLDHHGNFPVEEEPQTEHVMFHVPCGTRGFGKLQASGYVHIIPSKTCRRPIFDMETRQVVHVDLHVSQSEKTQQLSWMDRTTCPRSRVYVNVDKEDMENQMEHPRRKDVLNNQLAGFIAGLAQFEGWPRRIRSLPRLLTLLAHEDESIKGMVDQTVQRLELQGLLRMDESEMGPVISLHNSIQNTFFALLPLVNYDTRLAYLLVQPSDSMTTWLNIQVAATLSIGQDELVSFKLGLCTLEDRSYVGIAMTTGYGANLAHLGTLWMVLGLLKRGKSEMVYKDNSRPFVDEKVSLKYGACQEWEIRCHELHSVLSPGQPPIDILDEIGTLTEDQIDSLHWDFLRAFAFQIGVVNFPGDDHRPLVHDFVLGVELAWDCAMVIIDFESIKENDPECVVGFYTTLFQSEVQPRTTIKDWNWIPSSVWRRWIQRLEEDGSDHWASLVNKYDLGDNRDEFKYE